MRKCKAHSRNGTKGALSLVPSVTVHTESTYGRLYLQACISPQAGVGGVQIMEKYSPSYVSALGER